MIITIYSEIIFLEWGMTSRNIQSSFIFIKRESSHNLNTSLSEKNLNKLEI